MKGEAANHTSAPVTVCEAKSRSAAARGRAKYTLSATAAAVMKARAEKKTGGEELQALSTPAARDRAGTSEEERQYATLETASDWKTRGNLPGAANGKAKDERVGRDRHGQKAKTTSLLSVGSTKRHSMDLASEIPLRHASATPTAKAPTASNVESKGAATSMLLIAEIPTVTTSSGTLKELSHENQSALPERPSHRKRTAEGEPSGAICYGGSSDGSSDSTASTCSSSYQSSMSEGCETPLTSTSRTPVAASVSTGTEWLPSAPDTSPASVSSSNRTCGVPSVLTNRIGTEPGKSDAYLLITPRRHQQLQQESAGIQERYSQQQKDSELEKRMCKLTLLSKRQQQRQDIECVDAQENQQMSQHLGSAAKELLSGVKEATLFAQAYLSTYGMPISFPCALENFERQATSRASTGNSGTQYITTSTSATSTDAACGRATEATVVQGLKTKLDTQAVALPANGAGGEAAAALDGRATAITTGTATAAREWTTVEEATARNSFTTRSADAIGTAAVGAAARMPSVPIDSPTGKAAAQHTKAVLEANVVAQQPADENDLSASLVPRNAAGTRQAAFKDIGPTVQDDTLTAAFPQLSMPTGVCTDTVPFQAHIRQSADEDATAAGVAAPSAAVSAPDTLVEIDHLSGRLAPNMFSRAVLTAIAEIGALTRTTGFSTRDSSDYIAVEDSNVASTPRSDPPSCVRAATTRDRNGSGTPGRHSGSTSNSSSSSSVQDSDTSDEGWMSPGCFGKQKSYTRHAENTRNTMSCKSGSTTNSICSVSSIESSKDTCSRGISESPNVTSCSGETGGRNGNRTRQCSRESLSGSSSASVLISLHRGSDEVVHQIQTGGGETTYESGQQKKPQQQETCRLHVTSSQPRQLPAAETAFVHGQQLQTAPRTHVTAVGAPDARNGCPPYRYHQQGDRATAAIVAAGATIAAAEKSTLEPASHSADMSALLDEDDHVKCGARIEKTARAGLNTAASTHSAAVRISNRQRDVLSHIFPKNVLVGEGTRRSTGEAAAVHEETFLTSERIPYASEKTSATPMQELRTAPNGHTEGDTATKTTCATSPPLQDAVIADILLGSNCVALSLESLMTLLLQKEQLSDVVQQLLVDQQHQQPKQSSQIPEAQQQAMPFMRPQVQQQQNLTPPELRNQASPALLKQQQHSSELLLQQHEYVTRLQQQQQQQLEQLLLHQRLQVQSSHQHSGLTSSTPVKSRPIAGSTLPAACSRITSSNLLSSDDSSRDTSRQEECESGRMSKQHPANVLDSGVLWNHKSLRNCHSVRDKNNCLQDVQERHSGLATDKGETTVAAQTTEEQAIARLRALVPARFPPLSASAVSGGRAVAEAGTLCSSSPGEKIVEKQAAGPPTTVEQHPPLRFIGDLPTEAKSSVQKQTAQQPFQCMPEAAEAQCQLLLHSLCDLSPAETAASPFKQHLNLHPTCIALATAAKYANPLECVSGLDPLPRGKRERLDQLQEHTRDVNCPKVKRRRVESLKEADMEAAHEDTAFKAALSRITLAGGTFAVEGSSAGLASTAWGAVARAAHNEKVAAATQEEILAGASTAVEAGHKHAAPSIKRKKADIETIDYAVRARTCERVSGVCFDRWNQGWIATWRKQRRPVHKHYSVKKYGFEQARLLAIHHRCCMVLQQQQEQLQKNQVLPRRNGESQEQAKQLKANQLLALQGNDKGQQSQWVNSEQGLERRHQPQPKHHRLQQAQTKVKQEPICTADSLKWASLFKLTIPKDSTAVQASTDFAARNLSPAASASAASGVWAPSELHDLGIAAAAACGAVAPEVTHTVAATGGPLASACLDGGVFVQASLQAAERKHPGELLNAESGEQMPQIATLGREAPVDAAPSALSTMQEISTAATEIPTSPPIVAASSTVRVEASAPVTVNVRRATLKREAPATRRRCQTTNLLTHEEKKDSTCTAGAAGVITRRRLAAVAVSVATRSLRATTPQTRLEHGDSPQQGLALSATDAPFPSSMDTTRSLKGKGKLQPQQEISDGCPDIGTLVGTMPKVERVSFDFTNHSWIAQWKQHGSATYRRFAVSKFGFYGAFQLAVLYKEQHYRPSALAAASSRAAVSVTTAGGELSAPKQRGRRGPGGGGRRSTRYRQQWRQHQQQRQKQKAREQRQEGEEGRLHVQSEGKEEELIQLENALDTEDSLHQPQQQEALEGYRDQQQGMGGDPRQKRLSQKQHQEAAREKKKRSAGPMQYLQPQQQQLAHRQGEQYLQGDQEREQGYPQDSMASRHQHKGAVELFQNALDQLQSFMYFEKKANPTPLSPKGTKKCVESTDALPCPHINGGPASSFAETYRAGNPNAVSLERGQEHVRPVEAVGEGDERMSNQEEGRQSVGSLLSGVDSSALAGNNTRGSQNIFVSSGDVTTPALEENVKGERSARAAPDEPATTAKAEVAVMPRPVSLTAGTSELVHVTAAASADGGEEFFSAAAQMNSYIQYLLANPSLSVQPRPQQHRHEDENDHMPQPKWQFEEGEQSRLLWAQQQNSVKQEDAAAAALRRDNKISGCEASLFMLPPLAFPITYKDIVTAQPPAEAICTQPPAGTRIDGLATAAIPPAATAPQTADHVLPTAIAASAAPENSLC